MEGPFFIGQFSGKPTLVDRDGIPIDNPRARRILAVIADSNWDISFGEIEQARRDFERRTRA